MKKCSYCGKEYPDDAVVCALDQNELVPVLPHASTIRSRPAIKFQTIVIKRFSSFSMLKIAFVGCTFSLFGFAVLMGVLAVFGCRSIFWNHRVITGVPGLMTSVLIGGTLSVVFTLFCWVGFVLSFLLFSRFGRLKLEYLPDELPTQENRTDDLGRPV